MSHLTLVLNADDFGRHAQINSAVEQAFEYGVLNSASLMIGGAAALEAVQIARRNPGLAVGLHLVVVDGPGALRKDFPNRPVRLGLRYSLLKSARAELVAEMEAQFERFAATGLELAHVDGHQHMHMHPVVFDLLLPLAEKFGARRIRIVKDDLRLALRHDHRRLIGKTLSAGIFAALAWRCRRRCRHTPLSTLDRTYGFYQSGAMDEQYVISILRQLNVSSEIYFHPTTGARLETLGPNPTDLQALLSPQVRDAIGSLNHPPPDREGASPLVSSIPPAMEGGSWTHA